MDKINKVIWILIFILVILIGIGMIVYFGNLNARLRQIDVQKQILDDRFENYHMQVKNLLGEVEDEQVLSDR